ncbi:MAG: hypothetical protein AB8H80_19360 [Planctomycetota bacterium]
MNNDPQTPRDDGSREDLLMQVMTGQVSLDDELVQRAMRADPTLAVELDDMLALADELQHSGEDDEALAAEALAAEALRAEDLAAEDLRAEDLAAAELAAVPPAANAPPARGPHLSTAPPAAAPRWGWLVAACVLIAGGLLAWRATLPATGPAPFDREAVLDRYQAWPQGEATWEALAEQGFIWRQQAPGATTKVVIRLPDLEPIEIDGGATGVACPPAVLQARPQVLNWELHVRQPGLRVPAKRCTATMR